MEQQGLFSRLTEVESLANKRIKDNNRSKDLYANYLSELDVDRAKYDELQAKYEITYKAVCVLQKMSDERNVKARMQIENMVNSALASIFVDELYKIEIDEYTHGEYMHAQILLVDEQGHKMQLKNTSGGGLKEIISLLCNVALIVFTDSSRLLILDETFHGLHNTYAEIALEILTKLAKDNGFLFIIVTQLPSMTTNPNAVTWRFIKDRNKGLMIQKSTRGEEEKSYVEPIKSVGAGSQ